MITLPIRSRSSKGLRHLTSFVSCANGHRYHERYSNVFRTVTEPLNANMQNPTTIENIDLLIIGAGPAGLAAAVEAQRGGISNLLVVEKGPFHSQMIRTYYKEGKRVDAQYAGVEALCFGMLCLRDGMHRSERRYVAYL